VWGTRPHTRRPGRGSGRGARGPENVRVAPDHVVRTDAGVSAQVRRALSGQLPADGAAYHRRLMVHAQHSAEEGWSTASACR
jgi:hypothetical protein